MCEICEVKEVFKSYKFCSDCLIYMFDISRNRLEKIIKIKDEKNAK